MISQFAQPHKHFPVGAVVHILSIIFYQLNTPIVFQDFADYPKTAEQPTPQYKFYKIFYDSL